MDERSTGLILRVRPLTETSLIVQWLTPDLGRFATVAKGGRRPKSSFRGKIDLFFLADFSFARSRRSDLHTLREVSLLDSLPGLRRDLLLLNQMSYATTLIEQTTETDTPLFEIFDLMIGFANRVANHPPQIVPMLAFEFKLLAALGVNPNLTERKLSPKAAKLIPMLTTGSWDDLAGVTADKPELREIYRFLNGFMMFHLGKIPMGRKNAFAPTVGGLLP